MYNQTGTTESEFQSCKPSRVNLKLWSSEEMFILTHYIDFIQHYIHQTNPLATLVELYINIDVLSSADQEQWWVEITSQKLQFQMLIRHSVQRIEPSCVLQTINGVHILRSLTSGQLNGLRNATKRVEVNWLKLTQTIYDHQSQVAKFTFISPFICGC